MRHLSEGALRRLHDDRFAGSNRERDHLAGCRRCQHRAEQVAADAANADRLFAATSSTAPAAAEPALARFRQGLGDAGPAAAALPTPPATRRRRLVLTGVAIPAVAVALVMSANAAGWLSIFSPTQVAPITLTADELNGLPDLSAYGSMNAAQLQPVHVSGPAQAAAMTGLKILQAPSLPADIPSSVRWEVVNRGTATFTLDAATAALRAARAGHPAPDIPAGLDGTSVTVVAGPAVFAVYGDSALPSGNGSDTSLPTLVIAEGVRPTASTNGASLQQLESFLVAQPGVSPELAAQIRAIGAPASTLPIPVISGLMTSQTVTIDGVQGVVASDSSGLASVVVWEKNAVVYAAGGALPQSEVLQVARSLR